MTLADTTLEVFVDGENVAKLERAETAPLEPAVADEFSAEDGIRLVFEREGRKITGLAVHAGRARNIRFIRTAQR